jgi:hypothetical protein
MGFGLQNEEIFKNVAVISICFLDPALAMALTFLRNNGRHSGSFHQVGM